MAQFPMGRNTGRNFPVRGPGLDELLELLQNQGLTTQDENIKQRLESLRRADAGTSPLRARLYESLYKTGPVDIGEMTVDQQRMPLSVENSIRSGNTTYAEQGARDEYGSLPITSFQETPSQSRRGRAASRDVELQQRANLPLEEETIRRGTTRSGRVIQASKPGLFESENTPKRGRRGRGRNEALTYGGKQNAESAPSEQPAFMQLGRDVDIIGMDEAARTADKPRGLPTLERDITDPDMTDDTVTADTQRVELDLEGMAPPQQTLLQRIGNALKNNPELAASGAQLLGGLISNAAQNRAQRRADRTTDQRVARANLISAITSGRARPTVERAQADTGGFMSLDTLGKAFQGGGAAVKGELSRQVEEAERERKAGLDERAAGLDERAAELAEAQAESLDAYRKGTLGQREKEFNAQQDLLDKQLEQELAKASGKDIPPPKLQEKYKAAGQVIDQVDNLVNLMDDAGALAKGFGLSTIRFLGFDSAPQFMESGQDTAEIKAAANALVQTLGQDMSGVLSDQDIRFIKEQSIDPEDNMEVALRKAALIRNRLIQSMTQNYNADSQNYNMTAFLPIVEKVVSGGNSGFEDSLAQDNISLGK